MEFHAARPGATAEAFGSLAARFRERQFAWSYEVLAAAVPQKGPPLAVLDLACGSGFLLALLAARRQPGLELIGIDMSAGELRLAAADLGGRARLIEARAQAIPVAARSVDVILCHMALMLMDGVDTALAGMARVLKPGGVVAAVVGGRTPPSPAFDAYIRILNRHFGKSGDGFSRLGDRRFRTEEGIDEVFAPHRRGVRVEEIRIPRQLTPEGAWAWFMRMYDIYRIDESERAGAPDCSAVVTQTDR